MSEPRQPVIPITQCGLFFSQLIMSLLAVMHKITELELSFPNHKPPDTCRLQMSVRLTDPLGPLAAGPVAHGANSSISVVCLLLCNMKILPSSV